MAGSWIGFVRSPYQKLFNSEPKVVEKPPTPPPVSPIQIDEPCRHVTDDNDENLNDVEVDIDDLTSITGYRDIAPAVTKTRTRLIRSDSFVRECRKLRRVKVNLLRAAGLSYDSARFSLLTENGIEMLFFYLSQHQAPIIFDTTKTIALSLILSEKLRSSTFTIQAVSGMQTNPAVMNTIKEAPCSISVRFDPICDIDMVAISQYTHIIVDFTTTHITDVQSLLNAFNSSASTGVIYASALKLTIKECEDIYKNLVFEIKMPPSGTRTSFSPKHRTIFVRITHRQGEMVIPLQDTRKLEHARKKGRPAKRSMPCAVVPEATVTSLQQQIPSMSISGTLENRIEPRPSTPRIQEESVIEFTRSESPLQQDFSFEHISNLSPRLINEPLAVVDDAPQEHPTEIEESRPASSVPLIVIEDAEEDEVTIRVAQLNKRLAAKVKAFNRFRSILSMDSSPEFGGSCPIPTDRCISILMERICVWMHANEGPHSFLDIRSKSATGIMLSQVFGSEISFGHVVYSREYNFSMHDAHRMFNYPLKTVVSTLSGITRDHFDGYSMLFASASCLGNRDHSILEAILDAFTFSENSRVLWLQMTKPQAKHVINHFSNLTFNLILERYPNKSNDPFYEILK